MANFDDLEFDLEGLDTLERPERKFPIGRTILGAIAPTLAPALFPTKEETKAILTAHRALRVPQQALFRFAERPEEGVREAIGSAIQTFRGEKPAISGRQLLKTRGVDLDETPSLAGEFLGAALDVLADPIFLIPSAVRGARLLAPTARLQTRLSNVLISGNRLTSKGQVIVNRIQQAALKQTGKMPSATQVVERLSGDLEGLLKKLSPVERFNLVTRGQLGGIPIPKIPKSLVTKFNLKPEQIARLQAGDFTGFPTAVVSAVKALAPVTPTPPAIVPPVAPEVAKPPIVEPPIEAPEIKPLIARPLPAGRVKPLIRQKTGQFVKVEPTIKEPQALKRLLTREQQVARDAGRAVKKETKQTLKILQKIKKEPIQAITFEERKEIETLKTQVNKARTLEQLKGLTAQIEEVKRRGKGKFIQTKQEKQLQFDLDRDLLVKTVSPEVKAITPIGLRAERIPKAREIPKILRATTLRPARIFDMFDKGQDFEGPHSKYFFNQANAAEDTKLRAITKRRTDMVRRMNDIGITNEQLYDTRIIDGTSFSVDEMISIYTGAKNPEKTLAIVHGNKIPYSTMRNVIAQMMPEEKALGEAIIQDYENNYERVRKEFIEYTDGKEDLGRVQGGYTPIRRTLSGYIPTENELAKEMLTRANLRKVFAERGFTKARLKIPKEFQQPIKLGELSLWSEQMMKQEHFIAYGNLLRDLQKMANDPKFSEAIRSRFGEPFLKATRNWVNRIGNPNIYKTYSGLEKTAATLRQNAAIAFLGLNLITITKQFPSLALFLDDVAIPELIGGIYDITTNFKKNMNLIHELSPQMKNRSIERELEELKQRDPNRFRELLKRFGRKGMIGIYEMDKLVTHSGWMAVFNKFSRLGFSEQEAANRATRSVLRTQPAAHAKDIAEIYATSEFLNWFTQFTNQLNQIYNIVTYDIPTKARTGKLRDAIRAAFGVALSAYLISWMARGRPPKTREELVNTIGEQGLSYIPVIGRGIVSKEKGFDFISIPAFSGFEAASEAIAALKKEKPGRALEKGLEAGAVLGGVPFAQPRRLFKGAAALIRGETRDPRRLLYSGYTLKEKGRRETGELDFESLDFEGMDFDFEGF